MPRHRTIACKHCGFLQLKRDEFCDRCGSMTARAESDLLARVVGALFMLAVVGIAYFAIPKLFAPLAPH